MQDLYFWNDWDKSSKRLYLIMLAGFGASLLFFFVSWLLGADQVLGWEVYGKMESVKVPVGTFQSGVFDVVLNADNFLIMEWFGASSLTVNAAMAYAYLIIIFTAACIILAAITSSGRFSYYIGMLLFMAFLVNFKLELLMLFGSEGRLGLILALALYLPASYYFHAINPNIRFGVRVLVFLAITLLLGVVIYSFSAVSHPFLYMAAYGIVAPYLIALLFVLMVSHEVVAAFMTIVTMGNNQHSKYSMRHFFVISLIYLLSLLLFYLNEIHVLRWEIIYVNPYILLIISAVLGIWGFRMRENQYENILGFKPVGAYVYMALGIMCFCTIGYFWSTSNDPILEAVKDIIIYTHLGYGIVFLMYIFINFIGPLSRNMQVHKILYKPNTMPYFTFRLAGLIAVIAFTLRANFEVPLFHSISGYYNGLGDLYTATGEAPLAETYYKQGGLYGSRNHRSNYALAALSKEKGDDLSAVFHYAEAISKRPTPYAYVNLSNVYLDQGRVFEALFILGDALKTFPDNPEIKNNLGLLYGKVGELDSAFLMLDQSFETGGRGETAGTNIMALAAKKAQYGRLDSLAEKYGKDSYWAAFANGTMLSSIKGEQFPSAPQEIPNDALSHLTFSGMYNYAFNRLFASDSIHVQRLLKYAAHPDNIFFKDHLQFVAAWGHYHNGNVAGAFQIMKRLASSSTPKAGYYYNTLGVWALWQGEPELSANFFEKARDNGHEGAGVNYAIALSEAGAIDNARHAWVEAIVSRDSVATANEQQVIELLSITSPDSALLLPENQAYLYWHYVPEKANNYINEAFIANFKTDNYKAKLLAELINYNIENGNLQQAKRYFSFFNSLKTNEVNMTTSAELLALDMALATKDITLLQQQTTALPLFFPQAQIKQIHKAALLAQHAGDTLKTTEFMEKLASNNPFYEIGVIEASNFFSKKDPSKAYDMLLEALELNPNAVPLMKAYVVQCGAMGLDNYAAYVLEQLEGLLPENEYALLENEYQEKLRETRESEF